MPPTVPVFDPPLLPMPRLGLGTWPMKGAECQAAVESALALGYRHIDTAEMYGNEAEVGAGLRAAGLPRDQVFVTSKAWWDRPDGASIRRACEASLDRLGLDHLDLYMIHWPSPQLRLEDALRGLARLREDGLARHVGVANFPAGLMRRALEAGLAPLACLQVEHHLFLDQTRLRELVVPRGLALTSYSPVAKGAIAEDATVVRIAAKHGATPAQVALAWLLAMPGVAAIPKSASPERQRENLEALRLRLDAADLEALAALPKDRRLVSPGFAPDWDS
ncbi:MAG TPA: aldo/keto reductase [Crenalkalicoccus sp.]|nr:aldo/keto reductase [Crenalkalicoccus sp.]